MYNTRTYAFNKCRNRYQLWIDHGRCEKLLPDTNTVIVCCWYSIYLLPTWTISSSLTGELVDCNGRLILAGFRTVYFHIFNIFIVSITQTQGDVKYLNCCGYIFLPISLPFIVTSTTAFKISWRPLASRHPALPSFTQLRLGNALYT